jgi:hypothetical protein
MSVDLRTPWRCVSTGRGFRVGIVNANEEMIASVCDMPYAEAIVAAINATHRPDCKQCGGVCGNGPGVCLIAQASANVQAWRAATQEQRTEADAKFHPDENVEEKRMVPRREATCRECAKPMSATPANDPEPDVCSSCAEAGELSGDSGGFGVQTIGGDTTWYATNEEALAAWGPGQRRVYR